MTSLRRLVRASLCTILIYTMLALTLFPQGFLHAQTTPTTTPPAAAPSTIAVDGSAILSPVVRQVANAYTAKHADVKIDVQVSGTSGGFDKLCSGSLDIAMAVSGITDQQAAACNAKNVNYVETLLGFDAAVIVVGSASKITCIASDDLVKLLSSSATGTIKNWNQVATTLADQPIGTVYVTTDARARDLVAPLLPGSILRTDLNGQSSLDALIAKLTAEPTSIALLTLGDFAAQSGKPFRALDVKNGAACITPNAANFAEARYPAAQPLYLYANVGSLARQSVADFMNSLVGNDGQSALSALNFIKADDTAYTRDQTYLTGKRAGRTFSRIQSVNVPADTQGTVTVGGAPSLAPIIKDISAAFQPRYAKVTVTPTTYSNEDGFIKLCANTIDMIGATRLPTDAELTACKNNNVQTLQLNLGAQAVVMLINSGNTFATCLTYDQIARIFGAASNGKVKKWSDVSDKFPATDLLILTPADGSSATDLLITSTYRAGSPTTTVSANATAAATGLATAAATAVPTIVPTVAPTAIPATLVPGSTAAATAAVSASNISAPLPRHDTVTNDDLLYRAAGTANAAGAITLMTYKEYQKVKAAVTLVQVDAGKGCVTPSDKTIADNTYPLTQRGYMFLNMNAFTRPEVKAFAWYLLSDDAVTVISGDKEPLSGIDAASFATARDTALQKFSQPVMTPTPLASATSGTPIPQPPAVIPLASPTPAAATQ